MAKEKEWEFITPIEKHLQNLIEKKEEELINTRIQQYVYQREYMHPVNIGKEEAKKNVDIYMKRAKALEEHLEIYELYAKQKGIKI